MTFWTYLFWLGNVFEEIISYLLIIIKKKIILYGIAWIKLTIINNKSLFCLSKKVCSKVFLEFYWLEVNNWCFQLLNEWKHIHFYCCAIGSWHIWPQYHLHFDLCSFRTFKLTGPFVTMIYKMLLGDLLRFGIIYVIFLTGFTQGLYCTLMPPSFLVDDFFFFFTAHWRCVPTKY